MNTETSSAPTARDTIGDRSAPRESGAVAPPRWRGRVIVLVAIALTALNLRTAVTGFSPLLAEAQRDLGFGSSTAGITGTAVTLCFAGFALLAPLVARRVGLERTVVLALVFTTAGIVLRSLAPSGAVLVIATVIAFAGVGTSNVVVIPLVREYFPDRVKTVSTIYMVALQVGQLAAPVIAVPLALSLGWRVAIGAWAALTAIALVLWIVVAVRARGNSQAEAVAADRLTEPAPDRGSPLWRTSFLWGLVGLMGMTALHTYALVTWVPAIFRSDGLSALSAGALLSVLVALGLAGALVIPPLVLRVRNAFVIVAICVVGLAAGYGGMLLWPAPGALAWVVLLGIGINTFPVCLTLIAARSRSSREATSVSGVVQGIGYAIGCAGPFVLGLIHQETGSWTVALWFLLLSVPVTAVSGWFATRARRVDEVR